MLIYRIQAHDGQGIYAKGSIGFYANRAAIAASKGEETFAVGDDRLHPGPDADEGLKTWWEGPGKTWTKKKQDWHLHGRTQFSCGFASIDQMLDWFPIEGFRMIDEHNEEAQLTERYHMQMWIYVYSVHANKVKKGKRQVMFKRDDPDFCRISHVIPIKDFLKLVDSVTNPV